MAGNTFKVSIKGLDQLIKNFKEAPEIVEPILQDGIVLAGAVLAENTNPSTTPWLTGNLARSFDPVTIGKLFARWFPRTEYARAVQYGLPPSPGRFVPQIGKRLVNGDNIGTWPGFKGRHYMENIQKASKQGIDMVFEKASVKIVKAIGKI